MTQGKVFIVGAGPGHPDLMTVRAQRVMGEADLVIYADSLVQEEVAHLVKPGAEVIASASLTLEWVVEKMVEGVKSGLTVARVHSGDPGLYGALFEQLGRLEAAGVEYEIIPGVSAVFAAAARLGVELTVPEVAQSLILTRMSGRASAVPSSENLESLASHRTTLAIYLSITRCREMVAELLAGGYPPETPAAAVYQVDWPGEQIIVCELAELAEKVARAGFSRQTLVLVGEAIAPALKRERGTGRSRLYHPAHSHIFRKGEPAANVPSLDSLPSVRPKSQNPEKGVLTLFTLTRSGTELATRLLEGGLTGENGERPDTYAPVRFAGPEMRAYRGKPLELIRELFSSGHPLILIMPVAVAVRAVGSLAQDKKSDPGIVVVDETGRFAVSFLGGHAGGANRLAARVAEISGGQAVITTASDIQGLPALDLLGKEAGWKIANPKNLTFASAALVNGETVAIWQEAGEGELLSGPPWDAPNLQRMEAPEQLTSPEIKAAVIVTYRKPEVFQAALQEKAVFYLPPVLVLGIGCKRGVSSEKIEQTVRTVLDEYGLAFEAVKFVASADLKQDEAGLIEFAARHGFKTRFYPVEALNGVEPALLPSPSAARDLIGVQGVAEPSALLASGATSLLLAKIKDTGVTVAVAVCRAETT